MAKTACAVIALIECKQCNGYIALGTCACNKNKDKQNGLFRKVAALASASAISPSPSRTTAPTNQHVKGAL